MVDADTFDVAATLKRQKTRITPSPAPEPSECRCLVRATDGKKKIRCSVRCLVMITPGVCIENHSGKIHQELIVIVLMIAADGQGSSQISNVICNCF